MLCTFSPPTILCDLYRTPEMSPKSSADKMLLILDTFPDTSVAFSSSFGCHVLRSWLPCTDLVSGLRPEMGKEKADKWILAPQEKRGKNGRKMGKLAQKWVTDGHFPFFGQFFPNLFFGPFFPISGRGVQGNQDRKPCGCFFTRLLCRTPSRQQDEREHS